MLLAEGRQMPRQFTIGEGFGGGDAQTAREAAIAPGNVAVEGKGFILHALGRSRHPLAGRCRFIRTAGEALEQANAELPLHGVQTAERSGMVDAERFCGAGEAACSMYRKHETRLVPVIHAAS